MNVTGRQWSLLIAWLTAALQPVGPYPILVLTGEQGSAKTTLAQVCRRLISLNYTFLCCYRGRQAEAKVGWPKTAAALSRALVRMAPQLPEIGVIVTFGRSHDGRIMSVVEATAQTQKTPV